MIYQPIRRAGSASGPGRFLLEGQSRIEHSPLNDFRLQFRDGQFEGDKTEFGEEFGLGYGAGILHGWLQ